MNVSVSTPEPLDGENRDSSLAHKERLGEGNAASEGRCSCPKCGIYKWYPPLLMLSTLLAGVFCWMYISKPVFLTQPRETFPVEARPAFQEGSPASDAELTDPPTAERGGELDPAIEGLPGEAGGSLEGEIVAGAVLSNEMRPLRVKREGPLLFKPFVLGLNSPEGEGEGEEEVAAEGGSESESESAEADSGSGEVENYRVQASFMAEFAADSDSPPESGDGKESPSN